MSFHVFFGFSSGLSGPLQVPTGTLERICKRIDITEKALGLERAQYKDNPVSWNHWKFKEAFAAVSDDVLCGTVEEHNEFVRRLWHQFREWSKSPVADGETLTPEDAAGFWYGLQILDVPVERWNGDYYRARMEAVYATLCKSAYGTEGVTFDAAKLTVKQASEVIGVFSQWLDHDDIRLEAPVGYDFLTDSDHYRWCDTCYKAIYEDDIGSRCASCPRKKCAIRKEYGEEETETDGD